MADVAYVLGTVEDIPFELDIDTPGSTFTASEWTAQAALCPINEPFNAATATWHNATLETVNGRHYVRVLAGTGGLQPTAGDYKGFVKLTKTLGGTETPVIRARGKISFGRG